MQKNLENKVPVIQEMRRKEQRKSNLLSRVEFYTQCEEEHES